MKKKHIVLNEETKILHNKVKAIIINKNPQEKITDDLIIRKVYKKYLGELI